MDIGTVDPEVYTLLYDIDKFLAQTSLTAVQRELIKLRTAQINGCAYCIQTHSERLLKMGETDKRMRGMLAWHESPYYSDDERALLALTDEITLIADKRVSDETYNRAVERFGEKTVAHLILAISNSNTWNRVAITTRMTPP